MPTPPTAQTARILSLIHILGFVDYFLIVWDFVHYAKSHGIPVGPGRGSAAGSMVSYTLGITDVDPIRYSLFFERFLNPERVSMPDIDMDFCVRRRGEVIDYVTRKYGADHVAQIVTFGTMAARMAIRDVGRALNLSSAETDAVAKQVPSGPGALNMTLDEALKLSKPLKDRYESDEKVKNLIDTARALEGMPRHASTHAAGVVITHRPVYEYVPLATNDGNPVTQYTICLLYTSGRAAWWKVRCRRRWRRFSYPDGGKCVFSLFVYPRKIAADEPRVLPALEQMIRERARHGNAPVPPAGAADGHGERRLAFFPEARELKIDKRREQAHVCLLYTSKSRRPRTSPRRSPRAAITISSSATTTCRNISSRRGKRTAVPISRASAAKGT